jgi:hypothetical protein
VSAHKSKSLRLEVGERHIYSLTFRELKFSETAFPYFATLFDRTGAMRPFAPVEYPRSRHLDTPTHKNSLASLTCQCTMLHPLCHHVVLK